MSKLFKIADKLYLSFSAVAILALAAVLYAQLVHPEIEKSKWHRAAQDAYAENIAMNAKAEPGSWRSRAKTCLNRFGSSDPLLDDCYSADDFPDGEIPSSILISIAGLAAASACLWGLRRWAIWVCR